MTKGSSDILSKMALPKAKALTFLGKEMPSLFLIRNSRALLVLSLHISALSLMSFAMAIYADELGYGFLANMWNIWVGPIIYYILRSLDVGKTLLRVQNIISYFFVVMLIVLDSVGLAKVIQAYRYCYGDLEDLCVDDDGSLKCREEFSSVVKSSSDLKSIDCKDSTEYVAVITSIGFNYASCLLLIPFLVIAVTVRQYLDTLETWSSEAFAPEDVSIKDAGCVIRKGLRVYSVDDQWSMAEPYLEAVREEENEDEELIANKA